jgi:hypothetical protein
MSVKHMTATFSKEGFETMKPGGAWHLANAHFETSDDVEIGGAKVAAGRYRILARKDDTGAWTLVLDKPARFSSEVSKEAIPVKTEFRSDGQLHEHLHLDVNPSGDKKNTVVNLEVAFDRHRATARIKIPGP